MAWQWIITVSILCVLGNNCSSSNTSELTPKKCQEIDYCHNYAKERGYVLISVCACLRACACLHFYHWLFLFSHFWAIILTSHDNKMWVLKKADQGLCLTRMTIEQQKRSFCHRNQNAIIVQMYVWNVAVTLALLNLFPAGANHRQGSEWERDGSSQGIHPCLAQ